MTIKCLGTGSKGNCYILTSEKGKQIVLECGIKYEKILASIKGFETLEGVLVSHEHTDHDKKAGKTTVSDLFAKSLIPTYSPKNCRVGEIYNLGDFKFIPLECKHNVVCYGYLIMVDNKTILFATDTQVIPRVNIKCDYYMVEVNYDMETMDRTIDYIFSQEDAPNHIPATYANHSALETVVDYFEYNLRGEKVNGIFTIHASNSGMLNQDRVYKELLKFSDNVIVMNGGLEIKC